MRRTLCFLLVLFPPFAFAAPLANQLAGHPSPYLALHAGDPVAWQDWSAAAVERARRENKLLYISIGYFSCHWCHVMQRESYQNAGIAKILNEHFIPVKVDRELEPTLDARMIEFAEETQGRSGWPLNVFVTPRGYPLYAVLYLPPEQFRQVLERLVKLWREDPEGLAQLARRAAPKAEGPGKPELDPGTVSELRRAVVNAALAMADTLQGGFGEQSKFPSSPQLDFLLDALRRRPDPKLREFLVLTFDHMADYGLYDHLGGGFFRYTVDPEWHTPHFEKMLYDNAQLADLYRRAAVVLKQPRYRAIAEETRAFMLARLKSPAGAFYASLSALDDKGIEGGYYLWDLDQLKKLLSPLELKAYRLAWGMTDAAPFDHGYLPIRSRSAADVAKALGRSQAQVEALLRSAADKLRAARARRKLPVDTKLLAGWNGLALSAFARAAAAGGGAKDRQAAEGIRRYLTTVLWDGKRLHRAVAGKRPVGRASVEDYAYVAEGLLDYARMTGREADYRQAAAVARAAWRRFYGKESWRMGEDSLIEAESGRDALYDGPMPSPSGILARASLALAERLRDDGLRRQALSALNSGHAMLKENPFWYATHIGAMPVE